MAFRILLIDNYDSYTYSLHHLIATACGAEPLTIPNDAFASWAEVRSALPPFDAVVISPGPGHPDTPGDFGVCGEAIGSGLPIFGVCLGHQGIALAFGGRVVRGAEPMHGRVSVVQRVGPSTLLADLPESFEAVRYHSLVAEEASLPACLRVTARSLDGTVQALEHTSLPVYGVQFHPESVSTQHGLQMMVNFLRAAGFVQGGVQVTLPRTVCTGEARAAAPSARAPSPQQMPECRPLDSGCGCGDPEVCAAVHAAAAPQSPQPPQPLQPVLLLCDLPLRGLESPAVFAELYGAAGVSFWLDSSTCATDADHAGGAAPCVPARARWSYMGKHGGPHASLLRCAAGSCRQYDAHGRARGAPVPAAEALALMRAQLAGWAGATPVVWSQAAAPVAAAEAEAAGAPAAMGAEAPSVAAALTVPFRGGYVGFFGYEAWRWLGPASTASELSAARAAAAAAAAAGGAAAEGRADGEAVDEAAFLFADRLLAFDHQEQRLYLLCLCEARGESRRLGEEWMLATAHGLEQLRLAPPPAAAPFAPAVVPSAPATTRSGAAAPTAAVAAAASSHPPAAASGLGLLAGFEPARGESRYLEDICAVFEALRRGDSYEVCLTTQMRRAAPPPPPLALYCTLRRVNPAPYAAYLRLDPRRRPAARGDAADELGEGGYAVCCSSPERFLRLKPDGAIESKPIKGTAARGSTADEDAAARDALHASEKDRAENLMIVDLIRNDLGRVCEVGSVVVPSLMNIESFASVHQLVSTVCGQLAPEHDALDAVAAAFPPGSMTGAPKVRTMRIIDELEQAAPRGVYSGALGFISVDGTTDLNVVIRTAVVSPSGVSLGAGGAVVTMSDGPAEWQEVLLKARPVMKAVAACAAAYGS